MRPLNEVTNELHSMLEVWEKVISYPETTPKTIAQMRLKIIHLCEMLDRIERQEGS